MTATTRPSPETPAALRTAAACLTALAYYARPHRYGTNEHHTIRLLRNLTPQACARAGLPTDDTTLTRVLAAAINALLHVSGVRPGELARYLDALTGQQRRELLDHAHLFLTTAPIPPHSKD